MGFRIVQSHASHVGSVALLRLFLENEIRSSAEDHAKREDDIRRCIDPLGIAVTNGLIGEHNAV